MGDSVGTEICSKIKKKNVNENKKVLFDSIVSRSARTTPDYIICRNCHILTPGKQQHTPFLGQCPFPGELIHTDNTFTPRLTPTSNYTVGSSPDLYHNVLCEVRSLTLISIP